MSRLTNSSCLPGAKVAVKLPQRDQLTTWPGDLLEKGILGNVKSLAGQPYEFNAGPFC